MADYLGTGKNKPGHWQEQEQWVGTASKGYTKTKTKVFIASNAPYTEADVARYWASKGLNIAKAQSDLFAAGYYAKNEMPTLGVRTQSDIDALRRAMTDANLNGGTDVRKILDVQIQAVASNVRSMWYGAAVKTPKAGSGSGSSKPTTQKYISITAPKTAKDNLRAAMLASLGRVPTDAEYADYVTQLNANENKYYRQTTYKADGSQTTTGVEFDRDGFLSKYILSKGQFQSDLSGKFGDIQDTVNQLVNDNGISGAVTVNQKTAWMKQLAEGADVNTIKANIHAISKTAYSAFSDLLQNNPTMSLRDVASPYLSTYANIFELDPNTVNLKDALSIAANSANGQRLSLSDYEKTLKADQRYQFTKSAKQEAASAATAFARSFGVNI